VEPNSRCSQKIISFGCLELNTSITFREYGLLAAYLLVMLCRSDPSLFVQIFSDATRKKE